MERDHAWQFYNTSERAWDAMLLAISNAKQSIELEQYIVWHDEIGKKFIDVLKAKALEGLDVRIFCDEVGSFSFYHSPLPEELKQAGAKIKFFNSIIPWSPRNETFWYFRDHKKLLIVDRQVGFTGGICFGETMKGWRESTVKIEGPVVAEMIESFEVMWQRSYKNVEYYFKKSAKNGRDFRYLTNSPLPDKHYLYKEFVRAVRKAEHYIYLTTPYFLPDSRLLRAMKQARRRGVEIRLLVPRTTNYKLLDIGMGSFFLDLLSQKMRIFRYSENNFIHAKTAVIDGIWATIGSLNLDNLSLRYNFEANIVSKDKHFAFEIEKQFLEDLKLSEELEIREWQNRSYLRKILEILVWPFRKLL